MCAYTGSSADSEDAKCWREKGDGPGVTAFLRKAKINCTKDEGKKLYRQIDTEV